MSENSNWTATTSTGWIHISPTAGTAGDVMQITTDEAQNPYEASEGTVTITTDNDVIVKTVKRCLPTVTRTECDVTFRISVDGGINYTTVIDDMPQSDLVVGYCENGIWKNNQRGIIIDNVYLLSKKYLDFGYPNPIITTTQLSQSDYDITYSIGDITSTVLGKNTGTPRTISATVSTDKCGFHATKTIELTQKGYLKENGEFDMDIFVRYAPSSMSTRYDGFDFVETDKNFITDSCEAGQHEFHFVGHKVTTFGPYKGPTYCGEVVTTDIVPPPEESDIEQDEVMLRILNPNDGSTGYIDEANPCIFHYYQNKSRTQNMGTNLIAFINNDTSVYAAPINFYVKKGECGPALWLHIKASKDYVPYTGATLDITYYVSDVETYNESAALTGYTISFAADRANQLGGIGSAVSVSPGVLKRAVKFNQNRYPNNWWKFTVTCNDVSDDAVLNLYQANIYEQNVIPYSDYFVFSYEWSNPSVFDAQIMSRVSNCPDLTWQSSGKNISGCTAGEAGSSKWVDLGGEIVYWNPTVYPITSNTTPYTKFIEWGNKYLGDDYCSGEESTIVCLRNLIDKTDENDNIYVDLYASWMDSGKDNIVVSYKQYNSTTTEGPLVFGNGGNVDTGTSEMIKERFTEQCNNKATNGVRYVPNSLVNKAYYVTEGKVPSSGTIPVKAKGSSNLTMVATSIECLDKIYTHVARLQHNKKANLTSIYYGFADTGLDSSGIVYRFKFNDEWHDSFDVSELMAAATNAEVNLNNFFVEVGYNNKLEYVCPLDEDIEVLNLNAGISNETYTKGEMGTEKTVGDFITNFKVTDGVTVVVDGKSVKTLNISFKFTDLQGGNDRTFTMQFVYTMLSSILGENCRVGVRLPRIEVTQSMNSRSRSRGQGGNIDYKWKELTGPDDWVCINGEKRRKTIQMVSTDGGRSYSETNTTGYSNTVLGTCGEPVTPDGIKAVANYINSNTDTIVCNGNSTLNEIQETSWGQFTTEFAGGNYGKFVTSVSSVDIGFSGTTASTCVNRIGKYAFMGCNHIKNVCGWQDSYDNAVKIPPSVKYIDTAAFGFMTNSLIHGTLGSYYDGPYLDNIVLPDNIEYIGDFAFDECGASRIVLSDNLNHIGRYAFRSQNIEKVVAKGTSNNDNYLYIPQGIDTISECMLIWCSNIREILLPSSVKYIEDKAFCDCTSLTSISPENIPGVVSIGYAAFSGCNNITSVEFPSTISHVDGFTNCSGLRSVVINTPDGYGISIGELAFANCTGLTNVTIPDGVTSLGNGAFKGCTSITSIVLPNTFSHMYDYVFSGCTSLTSVTINAIYPPELSYYSHLFDDAPSDLKIYVPCDSLEIYKHTQYWTDYANMIYSIEETCHDDYDPATELKWRITYDSDGGRVYVKVSKPGTEGNDTIVNGEIFKNDIHTIELGECVTKIWSGAFTSYRSMISLTCYATTPPTMDSRALDDTRCTIYVPSASVDTYKATSGWSTYASRIQAIP